jgi:hypothetical protein
MKSKVPAWLQSARESLRSEAEKFRTSWREFLDWTQRHAAALGMAFTFIAMISTINQCRIAKALKEMTETNQAIQASVEAHQRRLTCGALFGLLMGIPERAHHSKADNVNLALQVNDLLQVGLDNPDILRDSRRLAEWRQAIGVLKFYTTPGLLSGLGWENKPWTDESFNPTFVKHLQQLANHIGLACLGNPAIASSYDSR